MSADEVRFRLSQRWRIFREQRGWQRRDSHSWLEFWNVEQIAHNILREAIQAGDASNAASLLPLYFATRKKPSFYFHQHEVDNFRAVHAAMFPERLKELRGEAEAICQHRFSIFAYPELTVGEKIPWQRDWIHGKQAANEHWARVPYLDFAKAGDSKIVWEPNRHQHFVTLGQTFFLTGEEGFARECFAQWDDWLHANPYGMGINWASSLELAFRAWSWIWALHLFQGTSLLDGDRLAAYLKSLTQHCDFIEQNISTYFSPNTHLLGEGFLLFVAGLLYPELRGAAGWGATGRRVLLEEMDRQVRPDGWHAEQSSYYHRYALDFFQCAAILADRNNCSFPSDYRNKLAKMYEVILVTQMPDGRQPMIGDADGGRLLPFSTKPAPRDSHDQRGALATAAVYFSRPDFRAAAATFHEETLWLLGPDAVKQFASLGTPEKATASTVFRDSGRVVMSDSSNHQNFLLFDAGPQGLQGCGHGHADALSVACAADGVDWLIDPGTYVYTASREWRAAFNGTRAHNTVVIDGLDQSVPVDFFKWKEIPDTKLELWLTSPSLDVAVGSHNGYRRLSEGVLHRRRVIFCKPHFWLITDELKGTGQHAAEFLFHFAPETKLEMRPNGCLAQRAGKSFLVLSSDRTLGFDVVEGDETNRIGWISQQYGSRIPAPVYRAKRAFSDSLVVTWLLCPNPAASAYDVKGDWKKLEVNAGNETHELCHGAPSSRVGRAGLSDAEFFYRVTGAGRTKMALFNGCCVFEDGRPALEAEAMQDFLECEQAGEELRITSKPERNFRCTAAGAKSVVWNGKAREFSRNGDWIEVRSS